MTPDAKGAGNTPAPRRNRPAVYDGVECPGCGRIEIDGDGDHCSYGGVGWLPVRLVRAEVTDEMIERGAALIPPGMAGAYPETTLRRVAEAILRAALEPPREDVPE